MENKDDDDKDDDWTLESKLTLGFKYPITVLILHTYHCSFQIYVYYIRCYVYDNVYIHRTVS
jgi:hypothetical protein